MSFRSTYTPRPTGSWVSADEKREMIADATAFLITKVSESTDTYNGQTKERFIVTARIADAPDEDRLLGFDQGSVFTRDDMLAEYAKYLEAGGEAESFIMVKVPGSQAVLLEFADAA